MAADNQGDNPQRARLSWFTILAAVLFVSTVFVGYCFAQGPIPWPTNTIRVLTDMSCPDNGSCAQDDCADFGQTCDAYDPPRYMAKRKFEMRKPWGTDCQNSLGNYCNSTNTGGGAIYPCAYSTYATGDGTCVTNICWWFPTKTGCIR
jgi:hypothetical protein